MTDPSESVRAAIGRDADDLRRGVAINFLGHALKLANPALLVFVTTAYGIERFGAFSVALVTILFAVRIGGLGLDKALLWWVARQPADRRRAHVRSAVILGTATTTLATGIVFALADPDLLARLGQPRALSAPLRILALSMVPQLCAELLTHAAMGLRRMEAHVLVKDAVVPITFPVVALVLFHGFGLADLGLPIAHAVATTVGLGGAMWMYRRLFGAMPPPSMSRRLPPPGLVRFAIPLWLAEVANSLLQRLDLMLVEAWTADLRLVGAYAVAMRFSNAIREIRRSFDPIVTAIAAEIGAHGDAARLRAGFSYATFLVTLTQLPVFAVLFAFAGDLTPLFGAGFEAATVPILVLGGVWLVNGLLSLAGVVVTAYGHSRQTLLATVVAIGLLAVAGSWLVPRYALEGAAVAVGIAYVGQGIVQVLQMRAVTGAWNYDRTILAPLGLGSLAAVAMAAAWWATAAVLPTLAAKAVGVTAFALVYGAGVLRWKRSGRLSRPAA